MAARVVNSTQMIFIQNNVYLISEVEADGGRNQLDIFLISRSALLIFVLQSIVFAACKHEYMNISPIINVVTPLEADTITDMYCSFFYLK